MIKGQQRSAPRKVPKQSVEKRTVSDFGILRSGKSAHLLTRRVPGDSSESFSYS